MKKAILLLAVVALSACQTNNNDGKAYADKMVRAAFGDKAFKPLQVDPNCPWCLVTRRCKVPTCPNQNEQTQY